MSFCFTFSFAMRAIAQIGAISLACHVVRYVFFQILGLRWHAIDASCVILSALMVANGFKIWAQQNW